jgi:hypothetical protein
LYALVWGLLIRMLVALAAAWGTWIVVPTTASASGPAALTGAADGAVVELAGTPHLWVAKGGALHWVGDTSALLGKAVRWEDRRSLSLEELRAARIGEPWLTAGLVKDGDAIYLAKWEAGWSAPKLLRVGSLEDVRLFGINGETYGRTVMDRETWGFLYGHRIASLLKGELEAATPAAGSYGASCPPPGACRGAR